MFNINYKKLEDIIAEAVMISEIDEKTFELAKKNYCFEIDGSSINIHREGGELEISEEKIQSPFTLLLDSEIGKFKVTESYIKGNQFKDEYGTETFAFFIMKLVKSFSSIILFLGYSYIFLKLLSNLFSFLHLPFYDYIIMFIMLYISYWKIYFYGREKNLRNKIKMLMYRFENSCREWIRQLYQRILTEPNSIMDIKRTITNELHSFIYMAQLSENDLNNLFNVDLKYLCNKVGIDFKTIVIENFSRIANYKAEQEMKKKLAKEEQLLENTYAWILNQQGIPENEMPKIDKNIYQKKSFSYGFWLRQNDPAKFKKDYEKWKKERKE